LSSHADVPINDYEPGCNTVDTFFSFLEQISFQAADRREEPIILRRSVTLLIRDKQIMGEVQRTCELEDLPTLD